MPFLVIGPELLLTVALQENSLVSRSNSNIVVQLLNVLIIELMEEVNNQSTRNLIDLDPRRMNQTFLRLSDTLSLISVHLEESLRLDNVETEVVIFMKSLLCHSIDLHRFSSQLVQKFLDVLLCHVLSHHRNNHSTRILDISQTTVKNAVSELRPQVFEMLVGLNGLIIGSESNVGPSSSLLIDRSINISNVPLRSLFLNELLQLV